MYPHPIALGLIFIFALAFTIHHIALEMSQEQEVAEALLTLQKSTPIAIPEKVIDPDCNDLVDDVCERVSDIVNDLDEIIWRLKSCLYRIEKDGARQEHFDKIRILSIRLTQNVDKAYP